VRRNSPTSQETEQNTSENSGDCSDDSRWAVDPEVDGFTPNPVEVVGDVLAFDSTFGANSRVYANQTPPVKVGSGLEIASPPAIAHATGQEGGSLAVRRLTPMECERQRLMGWPDDWTRWADDGTEIPDNARYRMTGNGVVSPVATWVGECIATAHAEVMS
jgi:site-specific DNA-cytosine methylase